MIEPRQLRDVVIVPTLIALEMYSDAAVALLLGTCAQESQMGRFLRQLGAGPARGIWQMEPATHDDLWDNYLAYQPELASKIRDLMSHGVFKSGEKAALHRELATNLAYACAMARVHYRRIKAPLPAADDIAGLAAYWKRFYNTPLGAGTEEEFRRNWAAYVEAYL